ncbi:MAG: transcriptional repressor LexA [Betaproteobacteria bacterium]|nr:transcriptional repressor LexA [Betaproteobacteria bacterium]
MDALTPKQKKIFDFIRKTIERSGLPPTRAEIQTAFGFRSPNAAEDHLRKLEQRNAIEILPGTARGIRLKDGMGLPLIGRVAAGSPILAEAHVQGRYQIDPALFKPRANYLLRVRGMSMRDAGILDGDLLAVHRTREARSGQIVVARVHDEVTVKRLRRRGASVELLPENPDFKPIVIDTREESFAIEGIAVGLVRNERSL